MHIHGKGGAEKRSLVMADVFSDQYIVFLIVNQDIDTSFLERYFAVNLGQVKIVVIPKYPNFLQSIGDRLPSRLGDFISHIYHFHRIKALGLDIFINNTMGSKLLSPTKLSIYMCMFPNEYGDIPISKNVIQQIYRVLINQLELVTGWHSRNAMESYSVITGNSVYTNTWIQKLWQLPSELVYTVCEDMGVAPSGTKIKIILNVGRFSAIALNISMKKQEVLLTAFKEQKELHHLGWELHLAGSLLTSDQESFAFAQSLMDAAKGYPVTFHFNLEFTQLRNLYHQASIYWHATGYGSDHPALQEHFGNTTVEAMSAGAVPIVINSGGQREIVTEAIDGFLWNTPVELITKTIKLAQDKNLLETLSTQAILSSHRFGRDKFSKRMEGVVSNLLQTLDQV